MAGPMPLEPPVTRATLPLNDFACIGHQNPLSHLLCPFWMILSRMAVQRLSRLSRMPESLRLLGFAITNFYLRAWNRSIQDGVLPLDAIVFDGNDSIHRTRIHFGTSRKRASRSRAATGSNRQANESP